LSIQYKSDLFVQAMNINWHKVLISRTVVSVEIRALPKVYRFPDCNCATHFSHATPSHSYSAGSVVTKYIKFRSVFAVSFWSTEPLYGAMCVEKVGRREVRLSGRYVNYCPFSSPSERGRFKRKTWLTFKARSASSLNKRSPSISPILCFHPPLYLWLAYTYILVRYVLYFG